MADSEKVHKKSKAKSKGKGKAKRDLDLDIQAESAAVGAEAAGPDEAIRQPTVKDLILNAGAAMGGLFDDEPIEPNEPNEPNQPAHTSEPALEPESSPSLAGKETEAIGGEEPAVEIEWQLANVEMIEDESSEVLECEDAERTDRIEPAIAEKMNALSERIESEELDFEFTNEAAEEVAEDAVVEATNVTEATAAAEVEAEAETEVAEVEEIEAARVAEAAVDADEAVDEDDDMNDVDARLADQELGPAEFIEADQVQAIIESLLFSMDRPVSLNTIKQIFKGSNIRTKDITRALDNLASEYAHPTRGVSLEEVNGGYQLRTKVDNAEFLKRLNKARPFRLSGPALEVLSIIAYKQPITKHEVDEIRGVESGHLIRALMERALVSFAGKSDLPGKPMQYGTTRRFLETFGLRNLKELPTLAEIDELLPEGIGDEQEEKKVGLSDITDAMSEEVKGVYSEGEEELEKITDQLNKIDTSSEYFEQEKNRQRDKRDAERAANIQEAIAVGETVEDKDIKWLRRYEAKFASQESEANAAVVDGQQGIEAESKSKSKSKSESESESESVTTAADGFRKDLEGLSADYGRDSGDESLTDEDAELDDFVNGSDWDNLGESESLDEDDEEFKA